MNTLIITGWGWKDYGCAAAVALRKFSDAKVIGSSTKRLPEKLAELADSPPDKLKTIILLGIGWHGDPDNLLALVKRLHDKKIAVQWLSTLDLPEWLPAEFNKFVDCKIALDDECLTTWVAKLYQQDASDLETLLDSEGKKNIRKNLAQKLLLLEAAMYFYRNYQDFDAYGAAIRTLAEGRDQFSEEQNDMIKHFERYGTRELIGKSPMIKHLWALINKVGPKDSARVLIWGETGTGKETVALQLHFKSPRRHEPFIVANCATLSPQLLISQLFGHKKGAFTGAVENHDGYFKEADGGTLFMDEIGELPPEAQAGLLRVLQDGRFYRLGDNEEFKVNVRIIAATNRNLAQMVRDGKFREDLFHRLNVVQFNLPPLRERGEDILVLAGHFLKLFRATMNKHVNGLTQATRQKLLAHRWPGNVRELRNAIERALILETTHEIQPASLPDFQIEARLQKTAASPADDDESLDDALARIERELITGAMEANDFNLTRAAESLKLTRHSLRYRMQRLRMNPGDGDANEAAAEKIDET